MFKRKIVRSRQTSVILPSDTVENLDVLVDQTESTRSSVMSKLLDYVLEKEGVLDEVFGPMQEDDEEESEI